LLRLSAKGSPSIATATGLLSVVVPLYNEEEIVVELVTRLVEACRGTGMNAEVVVVNDGSRDSTLDRLIGLTSRFSELYVIDLIRNFGQMAALSAGLERARGDAVVVIDGDLQDPPEVIPEMVKEWQAGAEVVYGLRHGSGDSMPKRMASRTFYWIVARMSSVDIPEEVGTFGLMDRRIVEIMCALPERTRDFARLRAWAGGRSASVPYRRAARTNGPSRFGVIRLTGLALLSFTSFSKVPLRLASILSLGLGVFLLLFGAAAVVIRLVSNNVVPGWAATSVLLGLMGSVLSLVLAVIAEYIGVIFDEVKARPLYLVRYEYHDGRPRELGQTSAKARRVRT
jgi:glycosyltransferase involved in cell wall biosynthesis